MKKTHKNAFTKQEVQELQANRYVRYVSQSTVQFTEEFKQLFWEKKLSGKQNAEIFRECGISPEVLGPCRIRNFAYLLNKAADHESGFRDRRSQNCRKPPMEDGESSLEAQVRQLKHELAYTRQEVEFLKKLQAADMEARRQWESRHRPK